MSCDASEIALKEIDKLAEAGLCAGTFVGAREFLKDIRSIVKACGLQGGLAAFKQVDRAAGERYLMKISGNDAP